MRPALTTPTPFWIIAQHPERHTADPIARLIWSTISQDRIADAINQHRKHQHPYGLMAIIPPGMTAYQEGDPDDFSHINKPTPVYYDPFTPICVNRTGYFITKPSSKPQALWDAYIYQNTNQVILTAITSPETEPVDLDALANAPAILCPADGDATVLPANDVLLTPDLSLRHSISAPIAA